MPFSFTLLNPALNKERNLFRQREYKHHNMLFRHCRVQCNLSNLRRTTGGTVGLKKPCEGGRKLIAQAQAQMVRYYKAPWPFLNCQ